MVGRMQRYGLAVVFSVVASAAVAIGALPGAAGASVQQESAPPDLAVAWSRYYTLDQLDVGTNGSFSVEVTNTGDLATGAVLVLDVSPGLELQSGAIGWYGRPCAVSASTATCNLGTLTSSTFVGFSVTAVEEGPNDLEFVAHSDEVDADPTDNTFGAPVYVRGPSAVDVRITGSVTPESVAPTEHLTYGLAVENSFDFPTSGVEVTATVPDAFQVASASIGLLRSCSVAGQDVTCDIGELSARGSASMWIDLVALDVPGTVQLSARVLAGLPDPFPDNDVTTSSATIEGVRQQPDLAVHLDVPTTAPTGSTVTGKLSVTNSGGQVTGVVAQLQVPEGMGLVSATTGLVAHSCAIDGTSVTCPLGTSAAFWTVDLVFTPADGTYEVTASVWSDQADADPSSNETTSAITVGGPAPIRFSLKSGVSLDLVRPGDALTDRLDVANASTVPASQVVVATTVPGSFEIRSARIGWFARPCTVVGQDVSCSLGDLAPGASRFVLLDLVVAADAPSGTVQLAAGIVGADPPPQVAGSLATTKVAIDASGALPDLAVTGTLAASTTVGAPATARFSATNSGGPATDVGLTIEVPAGLDVVSTAVGWLGRPCSVSGSTVTCSFSPSTVGWFASIVVQPTSPGTYEILAAVSGGQDDANPSDDETVLTTATA